MSYDWNDEIMPDDGDYGISVGEAMLDVVMFLAKVLGTILIAALMIGGLVYGIWREVAIFNLLVNQ